MPSWLSIVGMGDDGYPGLGRDARRALWRAPRIVGAPRLLERLPLRLRDRGTPWPSPFSVESLLATKDAEASVPAPTATPLAQVCVLASGDPMFYGVGASLAARLPAGDFTVYPAPSSFSWAAARLGWRLQDVDTVSLVGRPLARLNAYLHDGVRLLVLSADASTPAAVAALLDARGFGTSRMIVMEHLAGERERHLTGIANTWCEPAGADLNLIAIECLASPNAIIHAVSAGLPDDLYKHDGQLTKRDVRAIVLARLAPSPGEWLWDVGAGCGSIGIEWMRSHTHCRAVAIEADVSRQALIAHNRDALGVPALRIVKGRAPEVFQSIDVQAPHELSPAPDAIFIGGGVTVPEMLETCWHHLKPGGRLLANAVTVQSEQVLLAWRERYGGELIRIRIEKTDRLGGFDTWRSALPITMLLCVKPHAALDARDAKDEKRSDHQ